MKSYLALHNSSVNYCKHAHTSTRVAGGSITNDRFAWYPGHPLYHLFHVGAWKTLVMIVLHTYSMYHITSLKDDFLPYVLLLSYLLSEEATGLVMDFLFYNTSSDHDLLAELILAKRYKLAQWVIKNRLRSHVQFFRSNIFNL